MSLDLNVYKVVETRTTQTPGMTLSIGRKYLGRWDFEHRNSMYNIQVLINYTEGLDTWIQDFDTIALAILDNGESYQNYNDATLENYLERYYGSNLPRLLELKRNMDPTNFFRFPQSIPVIWNENEYKN